MYQSQRREFQFPERKFGKGRDYLNWFRKKITKADIEEKEIK